MVKCGHFSCNNMNINLNSSKTTVNISCIGHNSCVNSNFNKVHNTSKLVITCGTGDSSCKKLNINATNHSNVDVKYAIAQPDYILYFCVLKVQIFYI